MESAIVPVEQELAYSPSAVLHLFNNALMVSQSRKLIQLKGVYLPGRGANYNGYYYDALRDEASDATLSPIVPALIRNQLQPGKTIMCYGYITRKVVSNGGRIEIQINMSELLEQRASKYTDEDVRSLEVQQRKASAGYRDVHAFLKDRIIRDEPVRICIIIGKTAIIDSDIRHQLEETISCYQIRFSKTNLYSEQEIIDTMQREDDGATDILVVSRGGGENLEIFNRCAIAAASLELQAYFLTAIGHKEDVTLLQKVADKAFITPTALGQYLNEVYNQTREELQHSKAHLISSITEQLRAGYEKQIKNFEAQLQAVETLNRKSKEDIQILHEQELRLLKEQQTGKEALLNSYKERLDQIQQQLDRQPAYKINWLYVLLAVLGGALAGFVLSQLV